MTGASNNVYPKIYDTVSYSDDYSFRDKIKLLLKDVDGGGLQPNNSLYKFWACWYMMKDKLTENINGEQNLYYCEMTSKLLNKATDIFLELWGKKQKKGECIIQVNKTDGQLVYVYQKGKGYTRHVKEEAAAKKYKFYQAYCIQQRLLRMATWVDTVKIIEVEK